MSESKILPLEKVLELIEISKLPFAIGGKKYILENYIDNPEMYTKWFNKAINQLKRNRMEGSEYSIWIAANCVESIKRNCFVCYYCRLGFSKQNNIEPEFEHFASLVALHCQSNFAVEIMKKSIVEDFHEKLISQRKGDIINQYCDIFRQNYTSFQKEIYN